MPLVDRPVDEDTYRDVRREYLALAADAPTRVTVRARIIEHLAARPPASDHRVRKEQMLELGTLMRPVDFSDAHFLAPLQTFLEATRDSADRIGDEATSIAALLYLTELNPTNEEWRASLDELVAFSISSRTGTADAPITGRWIEAAMGLLTTWDEVAQLCPHPRLLANLAERYVSVRRSLLQGDRPPASSFDEAQMAPLLAQRIPFELVALFLRNGDLVNARAQLAALAEHAQGSRREGIETQLARLLDDAQDPSATGASALIELSSGYGTPHPEVSEELCRIGYRRDPSDSRFVLCLARIAQSREQAGEAIAWFRTAIEVAPGDQSVYDEALSNLRAATRQIPSDERSLLEVRRLGRFGLEILEARALRFGQTPPPPVTVYELSMQLAAAEEAAGAIDVSALHYQRALRESATRRAQAGIAELALLRGRYGDAIRGFETALATPTDNDQATPSELGLKAMLADALRRSGASERSQRLYQEIATGPELLPLHASLYRQPTNNEATRALALQLIERAPQSAPTVLSMLLGSAGGQTQNTENLTALAATAREVLQAALLARAWDAQFRVYMHAWVNALARITGAPEISVAELNVRRDWAGTLAKFSSNALSAEDLLAAARTRGERCEASFYIALRAWSARETDAANRGFQATLDTGMVRFFEYQIALELRGH